MNESLICPQFRNRSMSEAYVRQIDLVNLPQLPDHEQDENYFMALPDLSHELAALLEHTARTAIAIRQHSPYSRPAGLSEPPENQYDLLWLADSLHNFDSLGRAIIEQNPDRIVFACDLLSSLYQRYGSEKNNSKDTFERARKYGISLDHAIEIFTQIRDKVRPTKTV